MTDHGTLHRRTDDFGKSPAALVHNLDITDGAVRLYAHMHWRYGSNRDNHEGVTSMATFMGVSEATICKRIKELEAQDWVVTIERDYNPTTGKYQTPYYHVFELQEDCRAFREQYQPKEGERVSPKPTEARQRKSRKGIGGNPRLLNSSSPGNSSFTVPDNSSSSNPDSVDPDPIKRDNAPAKPQPSKRTHKLNVIPFDENKNRQRKSYEDVPQDTRWGIINAWCSNLRAQPVGAFKKDSNHETAAEIHRAGYTEEQVDAFVRWTRDQSYWKGKTLKLEKVAELLPGWLVERQGGTDLKPRGIWSQTAPDTAPKSNLTPEERAALVASGRAAKAAAMREANAEKRAG